MTLPIVMTPTGLQPQSPTDLNAQIIAAAAALVPDLTTVLPGSLIEDLSSTGTGIAVVCDQAVVESINNVTPVGANQFVLGNLGQIYGVTPNTPTNTSVYVTFTGPIGFVINPGFIVSDGTYSYVVQDGGVIESSGSSAPLYCVATQTGTWAVLPSTVTTIITSLPTGITLTCTNVTSGTPGVGAESTASYRARVMQAGQSISNGMTTATKSLVQAVSGVQSRLVSIQQEASLWKVIVGGGDPYAVAYAIFRGMGDISVLTGHTAGGQNISVSIQDFPDTYSVLFVNPPQQTVTMSVTWNTASANFVDPAAMAAAAQPALVSYINSITVGNPINLFELQAAFQASTNNVIPTALLTRMVFDVYINGTLVAPTSGTGIIAGDSESYFYATAAGITINQG